MGRISEYVNNAGIYKLTCHKNNKVYIGKSINIRNRLKQHRSSKNVSLLQRAILKHGWDSFNIEILEIVEDFDKLKDNVSLLEREAYYIELFESADTTKGYNVSKFSTDRTGLICSEETKKKISIGNLGKKYSDETREKMRKPKSDETREKMRNSKLGKPSNKLGKKLSPETRGKIREANLGKKLSEETKEKMRQYHIKRRDLNKNLL